MGHHAILVKRNCHNSSVTVCCTLYNISFITCTGEIEASEICNTHFPTDAIIFHALEKRKRCNFCITSGNLPELNLKFEVELLRNRATFVFSRVEKPVVLFPTFRTGNHLIEVELAAFDEVEIRRIKNTSDKLTFHTPPLQLKFYTARL